MAYTLEVLNTESGEILHTSEHYMINDALFSFAGLYGYPKCADNLVMRIKHEGMTYYEWNS